MDSIDNKPIYKTVDGVYCLMNINHWMVERCDNTEPENAIGFLHVSPSKQPDCPSDVGANWRFFQDSGEVVQPDISVECEACCGLVSLRAGMVLGADVSGIYRFKSRKSNDKPIYETADGIYCLMNVNHWMVERCDNADPANAKGFLHVSPTKQPDCPTDVGANWRFYQDSGEVVQPDISVECEACCGSLTLSAGIVLGTDVSGVYTLKRRGSNGKPIYETADGVYCIMIINHWMVERCDNGDPANAKGFLHGQTDSIWLRWWESVGLVLWWEKSRRTMWLIGKIPF